MAGGITSASGSGSRTLSSFPNGILMKKQKSNEPDSDLPAGLAKPAIRALNGAGITHLEQLAKFKEADIMKLHGMGPNAMSKLREAPDAKGLNFAG